MSWESGPSLQDARRRGLVQFANGGVGVATGRNWNVDGAAAEAARKTQMVVDKGLPKQMLMGLPLKMYQMRPQTP